MNNNNLFSLLSTLNSDPLFKRAQTMAAGKSEAELIQIARNVCNEKGLKFDEAYSAFQNQFMKGR